MKYQNAAEILPERLLKELQEYMNGELLYIPRADKKRGWGAESGSRRYYTERNEEIRRLFRSGVPISQLSKRYGLAGSTIKKIIYQ